MVDGADIAVGCYTVSAHRYPDGRCVVVVKRFDRLDEHDHKHGPEYTIDLDYLFAAIERRDTGIGPLPNPVAVICADPRILRAIEEQDYLRSLPNVL